MNEHLLANSYKILVLNRMMFNENNFRDKPTIPDNWLHPTLIYLKNIGKERWIEALIIYGKQNNKVHWTDQLIRRMDKKNDLQGIQMLTSRMGHLDWSDHLPKEAHFKPLLIKLLVAWWVKVKAVCDIKPDGLLEMAPVYELQTVKENRFTEIKHCSGAVIEIDDELLVKSDGTWAVDDNWSWCNASLKGKRRHENVYDMFHEAGAITTIEYDSDCFLDDGIRDLLNADEQFRNVFEASTKEVDAFVKAEETAALESSPHKPSGPREPQL